MSMSSVRVFVALALPIVTLAAGPTSIFINQVPEYRLLETCAEVKLSTIVRNMEFGCGDGSVTTSYACFCYESSAKFSSMIGKHVSTNCPEFPAQNSSAIDVFSKYCELGAIRIEPLTTNPPATFTSSDATKDTPSPSSSPPPSSSPSPGSSPATTSSSPTSSPVSQGQESPPPPPPPPPPPKKSNTTAIAAGISVPIGVLLIGAAAFLVYKHRNPRERSSELAADDIYERDQFEIYEISSDPKPRELDVPPAELAAIGRKGELPGNTY